MSSLIRRVPHLASLAFFEAAGRLMSFTRAAEELHVTQGAVSRQIRLLEERVGVGLFRRRHRAVELTPEGRRYHRAVTMALEHIADATEELRSRQTEGQVTVAATSAVSMYWLMPRLASLRARYPDLDVQVLASDLDLHLLEGHFDIGIQYGSGRWPGFRSELLGPGEVFPVCSPQYLEGRAPLTDPAELLRESLLQLEDERWDWIDWPVWFREVGVRGPYPKPALRVNSYPLLNKAAFEGQGIMLGWRYLVDEHLQRNWLVVACEARFKTERGFHLVLREGATLSPETCLVKEWIVEEFRGD